MPFLIGLLTSKETWIVLAVIALYTIGFSSGYNYRKDKEIRKQSNETIEVLNEVIQKKDAIRKHYSSIPLDTIRDYERVLSMQTTLNSQTTLP